MSEIVAVIPILDLIAREALIFAAIGFLIGGIDDLLVDLVFAWAWLRRRWRPRSALPLNGAQPLLAVFVPAWDEASVIGPMLRTALARYAYDDYRIYVGTYPNDPATIRAVGAVAANDARVRLAIGDRPGPTTKADCLNTLWRALIADEADSGVVRAVILHDAEDVVHRDELRLFAAALADCVGVQLPVLPLPDPASPLIAGHYVDEFAEAPWALSKKAA